MTLVLVVQVLVVIIVFGIVYSLWQTTKSYGGLIGAALKWIGLGMVFFSLEALDRVLVNLSFINSFGFSDPSLVHNIILVLGLLFSGLGFSKLTKIAK